ncbi:GNAT family N-acetyltransferase [Paenibacillus sp. SAF-054]|uniref:GNAT family N-acetyltransferase n=1 Tax=unclassified Paenibacillus TaxID=185978 RepID=UPI003F80B38F
MSQVLTAETVQLIEKSEMEYMLDRMTAIQERVGNPEGVELKHFGSALALYSRTMPWPAFNTVKGIASADLECMDAILDFYRTRGRSGQFEIVPSLVDQRYLKQLSERGYYQSGFHASLYTEPREIHETSPSHIRIEELQEDQFIQYAAIHCRGTGLPDEGIPSVAANNQVLYARPGWKFYIAYANEEPAAVGVMHMKNGIASLTFAATLPEFRNQGIQQRLLETRIDEAYRSGCRWVVGQCAFLSRSHRNMERVGMKLGYVRTSWTER